ncbi:MAG: ParB/RepB/Spo0J family partition protein [Clostridia bacterium]|nr:ParB/RepB/Spo0J family partition protein [Clostridia bacterium]
MAKSKGGLGRGLDALLGGLGGDANPLVNPLAENPQPEGGEAVVSLRLSDIDPNRDQPRKRFDEEAMNELAASIRSMGVIQPILVYRSGRRYTIIAGERRWRAARQAGLDEIPAIVRDWDEVKRLEAALIENLQRDDLNPVEEAMGVRGLMEQCGLTQEAAAERLGKSRPALANLLRLLTLPEPILDMLREGTLSAGHARALVTAPAGKQLRLAQTAAAQGWSVRQLERACKQLEAAPVRRPEPPRDPEFRQLERMARDVFGTKAELSGDENHGRLIVHYQTADDLQRIWDLLEIMRQGGQ